MVEKRVCGTCVHYPACTMSATPGEIIHSLLVRLIASNPGGGTRSRTSAAPAERWEEQETRESRSAKANRPRISRSIIGIGGSLEPRGLTLGKVQLRMPLL